MMFRRYQERKLEAAIKPAGQVYGGYPETYMLHTELGTKPTRRRTCPVCKGWGYVYRGRRQVACRRCDRGVVVEVVP